MLGREKRYTKTNLSLWIVVSMMAIIGLGADVYKANTGEGFEWSSAIAEACVLLAAGCFIFAYFHRGKEEKEE